MGQRRLSDLENEISPHRYSFSRLFLSLSLERQKGGGWTQPHRTVNEDETLRMIARELVSAVRSNATIDWMMGENVSAQLGVIVKQILRKHGVPPAKQEAATIIVLD